MAGTQLLGSRKIRRTRSLWDRPALWFAPVTVLLALITFYPLGFVFWLSLSHTRYYHIVGFVGLRNYIDVLGSSAFAETSCTSLLYVSGSLAIAVPLGMGAALGFQAVDRFASVFRAIALLPWTLSVGVVGSLWLWLLNPSYGPVSYAVQAAGRSPGLMLGDPRDAIWYLIVATGWWSFPYVMVLVTAALQSVPQELYEAAALDGAGAISGFRAVTWPHICPVLGSTALNLAILYLTIVTLILVMTGGGPLGSTSTWSFKIFLDTVQAVNIGPLAVYSVVVLIANLGLGYIYVRTTGRASG